MPIDLDLLETRREYQLDLLIAKRYCPGPISTTTESPSCRVPAMPLPFARRCPLSVTFANCAFGKRIVARVLAGTSTANSNLPSLIIQAELTLPYGVWWLALTLVNPPPGCG